MAPAADPSRIRLLAGATAWALTAAVFVGFILWSIQLARTVDQHRAVVEANVGLLIALQGAPTSELEQRLEENHLPSERTAAIRELRRRNADASTLLGAAWDSMFVVVITANLLALTSLMLGLAILVGWRRESQLAQALHQEAQRAAAADVLRAINEQLRDARDGALELERLQTHLLQVLGHELRTPLTTLRGHAEILEEELHDAASPLLSATRELERRSTQILELSVQQSAEPPALRLVLEDVLAPVCARYEVVLDGSATATIHPDRLVRVIEELLSNARQFATTVNARLETDAQEVRVVIEDDGPGMSAREAEEAVKPFWTADMRPTRRHRGLGLGLTVAHHHAKLGGGHLTLSATPGQGLTATLHLPG